MTITQLQEQAWATVAPGMVLKELQTGYQLKVNGQSLTITPAPCPRLAFQIRRHKVTLLELMGAGKTREERCKDGWRKLGIDPDTYQVEERTCLQQKNDYKGIAAFPVPTETPDPGEPEWGILKVIREEYCKHKDAQHYRVKDEGKIVVKLLCPECGHNLRGPRRMDSVKKRTDIPWWPKESPVQPDPDAETDALVEWWDTAEGNIIDGAVFCPGVTIANAGQFKRTMTELIGLWKLGESGAGLHAQLFSHKKYLEGAAA